MTDLSELDPIIHSVARLRIVAALAALSPQDSLTFTRLQSILNLTAGNMTTHLGKLDEAGYVTVLKEGAGRSATTTIALSTRGRYAYEHYAATLRSILDGPNATR